MDKEITRLKLPRGLWQQELLSTIPEIAQVNITYPDEMTLNVSMIGPDVTLEVAHFSMSFLYGCKAILISHNMNVHPDWRNLGIGKRLQPIKKRIARDLKAALLLATIREDNAAEKNVTKEWIYMTKFTNPRTKHIVEVYVAPIMKEPPA